MPTVSPDEPDPEQRARLERIVMSHPVLAAILDRWPSIALPDCWLSGTAIAQAAWNLAFGFAPAHGLADIDLVYFDATDLSEQEEESRAGRLRDLYADIPLPIDAKNQARVHLWYQAKFGYPIAPYRSASHAITTFPTTAGAVGIRPTAGELGIYAPFGLSDLLACIVRPNRTQITRAIYEAKVAKWRTRWPDLIVVGWADDEDAPAAISRRPRP